MASKLRRRNPHQPQGRCNSTSRKTRAEAKPQSYAARNTIKDTMSSMMTTRTSMNKMRFVCFASVFCVLIGHIYYEYLHDAATTPQPPQLNDKVSFQVENCCAERSNAQELWECVRKTTKAFSDEMLSSGKEVEAVVTTYATKDIVDYAAYATATVAAWAQEHGYPMRIYDETDGMFDANDQRWNKVMVVKDALTKWAPKTKSVLWVDADLTVLDFSISADDFLEQSPESLMFVCAEHGASSSYVNTGSFLAVNTPRAVELLDMWWIIDDRKLHSDQEAFDKMLPGTFQDQELHVLPPSFFNTDPPAMVKLVESDRVLHLMGEIMPNRVKVFGEAFNEVCLATKEGRALKHQLGITRDFILSTALEVYQQEYQHALDKFQGTNIMDFDQGHMMYLDKIANNLKLALQHSGNGPASEELMRSVYHQSRRKLKMLQETQRGIPLDSLRLQINQGLIVFSTLQDMKEIQDLYTELAADIDTIQASTRLLPFQVPGILGLRSQLDESMTVHYIYAQMYDKAVESQRRAIGVLEHPDIAEHTRTSPLGMLASLLCQTGRHSEAIPMFERVIQLEAAHFGADHRTVALRYLNMGVCKYNTGMFEAARSDLEKAKRIHIANKTPSYDREVQNINHHLQLATKATESL